jgi:hypothetical protein
MNTEKLKALALAATPSNEAQIMGHREWVICDKHEVGAISDQMNAGYMIAECHGIDKIKNAAYIAAANPAAILELIAERDELLALLKEAYGYTTASTTLLPERIKAALAKGGEA